MLRFKYTVQECMDEVRLKYPRANGFTIKNPCNYPTKCNCYAIIGMESVNNHNRHFKTCKFIDRGKYIKGYIISITLLQIKPTWFQNMRGLFLES